MLLLLVLFAVVVVVVYWYLIHPLSTIGRTTSAGYFVRIILNVKLIIVRELCNETTLNIN